MNESDIAVATSAIESLQTHPGWRDHLAPRLRKRVATIEADLLRHPTKLTADEAVAARAERHILLGILDSPRELLAGYAANLRQIQFHTAHDRLLPPAI